MHAKLWERKGWNDKCEIYPCHCCAAALGVLPTPSSRLQSGPDFTIIEFSSSKRSQRSTTWSDVCGLPYDLPLPEFLILFRSKQFLYFSWMQASNFYLFYSTLKSRETAALCARPQLQNVVILLQFMFAFGFHWVEWLYLFQTVKQSSSAKMLQGCWHLECYFQSYFTYAFKMYPMKNKNQIKEGLIGVSGKADDLLQP